MLHELGFGVGLRPPHYPDFHAKNTPKIDWLEIISENFMGIGGRPRRHIEKIRADYPIATHGIGLGIAGYDPLNERYLKLLKELMDWLQPAMVTDHLCWTSWKGQQAYDLLPFPLNEESLKHISARIQKVQDVLKRPMLLENPSMYIDFRASDMHEPDFLNALCEHTGCGILLDLNNCMVNSKNLGWDPELYIHRLKPEYVGQFHLAGHSVNPDICIDTHDQPVPDEVWKLYREAIKLFPGVPSLIEWDGKLPSLARLGEELDTARQHAAEAQTAPARERQPLSVPEIRATCHDSLESHQAKLFGILRREASHDAITELLQDTRVKPEFGLEAYQNNHFLGLLDALQKSFQTLHAIVEDDAMAEIVSQYIRHIPPEHFSINGAGTQLPTFLMEHPIGIDFGVPQALIAELAAFDAAHMELAMQPDPVHPPLELGVLLQWTPDEWDTASFVLRNEHRLLHLNWDVLSVYTTLQSGEVPPPPDLATSPILITRNEEGILFDHCPENIQNLLKAPEGPFTLVDLVEIFKSPDMSDEAATELALDALITGLKRSMIGLASV
ncbi:MAG TPA: DUF692 family protein [Oligoflexus sp.]|uniref:MNIO family bufferin maturase n=1 Tax=Oligoflexus sp. TaxID=1971216 RepID=UPI002D7E7EDF|nr:DUF692 family multinuclear iron-containing protein [Oligoflexus sp.]HET9237114.1 DUF692 family protein [Oligoflexus sp.]